MIKISACVAAATACMASTVPEPPLAGPWTDNLSQAVTGNDEMEISIALPSTNMDELKKFVDGVSTPGSPTYGQYMTAAEVRDLTKPDPENVDAVVGWIQSHDIVPKIAGSNVVFRAAPSKVEDIFETQVRSVRNTETGMTKLRAATYTIPSYLDQKIATIFGLHGLPLPRREAQLSSDPADVNPDTINIKYQVDGVPVSRSVKNRQAVAEFQGENAVQKDLDLFFKNQVNRTRYEDGDEVIYKTLGTFGPYPGTEASLDIQYIMGVAPGIKTELWGYKGRDFCKDLNEFTTQLVGMDDAPLVFSISYGWQGELSQIGCKESDSSTTNDNFVKIAARGISVLVSSGDAGSQYVKGLHPKLYPSWPASSPYVTAVGGTRFVDQDPKKAEMACDQFGSGGGFSFDFDRRHAHWQERAVTTYLDTDTTKPSSNDYATEGRGTPDVSGIAEGYAVYNGNMLQRVGGTSASAPMFAALVSLLNEARLNAGKAPMGLLNPFLYHNADAFTDVTLGTGAIGRSGYPFPEGWDCTKGWDAATGLGTPIFPRLLKAAMQEP